MIGSVKFQMQRVKSTLGVRVEFVLFASRNTAICEGDMDQKTATQREFHSWRRIVNHES